MEIPETHPLQQLFLELVGRHYAEEIGIRDPQIVGYVAHLLSEFCDAEQLLKIRNASGKPLNDVGEMLIESDPIYGPAPSFDRERQVRKHIGDFTLFYAGMFPEHQSLSPAPTAGRGFRGLDESRKRKLLHRLQVRALRIREGGAAVRATLTKI
jgi:hypothetical protein